MYKAMLPGELSLHSYDALQISRPFYFSEMAPMIALRLKRATSRSLGSTTFLRNAARDRGRNESACHN